MQGDNEVIQDAFKKGETTIILSKNKYFIHEKYGKNMVTKGYTTLDQSLN